jgi:lipoate-protein ligase A
MIKEMDYKVPNGKLIRVKADVKADVENNLLLLRDVKITGDFFLHPEESIEKIENSLKGKKLEREGLEKTIRRVVEEEDIKMLGVSEKDFVDALMML